MPAGLAAGLGVDIASPVLPGLWTAYFFASAYLLDRYFSIRQWWSVAIWTLFVTIGYPIVGLLVGPGMNNGQAWWQIMVPAIGAALVTSLGAGLLRTRETNS
jgi:hypothetical protein